MAFDMSQWAALGTERLVVLAILAIAWIGSELLYPRRVGKGIPTEDKGSSELIAAAAAASLVALAAFVPLGLGFLPGPAAPWVAVGLVSALAGTAVRYWAVLTLGPSFTSAVVVEHDQAVIEAGPYGWVRHPGYGGAVAFGVGIGLIIANGAVIAAFLATYGSAVIYRVRVEERALSARLGPAYEDYARRVRWRVIPGVY